jgi:hypothetical protein
LKKEFVKLDGGKCFVFGDGAFFQSESLDSFVEFYKGVRYTLFSNAAFFKCAIVKGELQAKIQGIDQNERFQSVDFGPAAAHAFMAQDAFKGVGSIVSVPSKDAQDEKFCQSFYFGNRSTLSAVSYIDIKYDLSDFNARATNTQGDFIDHDFNEIGRKTLFDVFINEAYMAKSRSVVYARYYIPTLVSMIRSANFDGLVFNGESWENAPPIFERLYLSKSLYKQFSAVKGFNFVYWAMLNEIWKQHRDIDWATKSQLISVLAQRAGVIKDVNQIPEHVASHSCRDEVLKIKAALDFS